MNDPAPAERPERPWTIDPYHTAPLDLRCQGLRLIGIQPSSNQDQTTDIIPCVLISCQIERLPKYDAVSYKWGFDKAQEKISLNGVRLSIGRNLWRFLQVLRQQKHDGWLWIDALCINQRDIKERNHQVQMMRRIYSRATSVLLWLGEADEDNLSDVAMDYLSQQRPPNPKSRIDAVPWTERQAAAVLALCQNGYWRRMWIIQEVVLAKTIVIYYGYKQVGWEAFELLLKKSKENFRLRATSAATVAGMRQRWHGKKQPLLKLLLYFHRHEATDIRDKIYALFGLAMEDRRLDVDYCIIPDELFKQVISSTMCTDENLSRMLARRLEVEYPEDEMRRYFGGIRAL